jgi:hypothetical protein
MDEFARKAFQRSKWAKKYKERNANLSAQQHEATPEAPAEEPGLFDAAPYVVPAKRPNKPLTKKTWDH